MYIYKKKRKNKKGKKERKNEQAATLEAHCIYIVYVVPPRIRGAEALVHVTAVMEASVGRAHPGSLRHLKRPGS